MVKKNPEELVKLSDHQFNLQYPMVQLYQTLADHFYPERADFTFTRNVGTDFADGLMDSYPIIARRDLGNSFAAMLRDGQWFEMDVQGEKDHDGKKWLEWASDRLLKLMRERGSGFTKSTKEGDHDYATFGQCVISVELNKYANGLLYRCWHLRDCAWWEDETGQVCGVIRKWKPTLTDLMSKFGNKCHTNISSKVEKEPFKHADIRHIVMPSEMYGDEFAGYPYVSIFLDVTNKHIMEEVGINHKYYVIPRFQTISGHPYAYSPAAIAALPNSRTLQAMTFTLMEAGERYVRPPMIAQDQVLRGDVDLSSNGITYIDNAYDERLGEALRPIAYDKGGFPIGLELRNDVTSIISSAFYLNKLSLPETGREMTAYEIQERMKQYRRENLPLFAPMESDYNGQLCEMSFEISLSAGFFGSIYDIPDSLKGRDYEFKFNSPLSQADKEMKGNIFGQMGQLLAEAVQFDDQIPDNVDFDEAFRDALDGINAPAKWMRSVEKVTQLRQMEAAQLATEQMAQ